MAAPLSSGRVWEVVPNATAIDDPGRSRLLRVRDKKQTTLTALFKWPPDDAPPGELYSIGMERVAYTLGDALGLPIPPVFLEHFDGHDGAILTLVQNEVSWLRFDANRLKNKELVNIGDIPRCVAFDVWLANIDRAKRNVLLQPDPVLVMHEEARRWMLWLIDHGHCGLWPPAKFGLKVDQRVADARLEDLEPAVEKIVTGAMHPGYVQALATAKPVDRNAALNAIRGVSDVVIADAVNEVPAPYFNDVERELTIAFLRGRRDNIVDLCASIQ